MGRWLTDDERQVSSGYNDGVMGEARQRNASDLYRQGYNRGLTDWKNRCATTGRHAAFAILGGSEDSEPQTKVG